MAATTKRNTYRLYLNDEDAGLMLKAAEVTELSQAEVMSKLLSAALRAIAKNDFRMPLPLKFEIVEPSTPKDLPPKVRR